PLHTHLKPLSWLQLLHPTDDPTYAEPHAVPDTDLAKWKSGKRGTYFKKRRRWERCRTIVDETREGGFDGLIVASNMDPATILPHTVPLIRGGGHVVVYAPTIEPLVNLMDLYSRERRTAYIQLLSSRKTTGTSPMQEEELTHDFPVDPRLLLAPTLQTSRVREWQVLPGRTHPNMTGRGGSEGFVFTARKVIPLEGAVEARGNFGKKRKVVAPSGSVMAAGSGAGGEGEGG
ncbi:putative eukaryotic translation initiation factor 3, gamma subunit, partial [Hortaea werneckii]